MTTYSSNLRLSLIASGAEAGTWGNTTNYNLGTLLEEAVAGAGIVIVSALDYALTANNGVEDESRMAILKIGTSAISAKFNVYAPPVSKIYLVWNTSAYDMWLYNSTVVGNTSPRGLYAVIKAGEKALVSSDGTDFYTVSSSTPSVSSVNASGGTTGMTFSGGPITTSGTLTMAGTLAVANGGTGSTTASGARTNLGLVIGTDVPSPTGTGASGTWAINISGNAVSATTATNATNATNATTATNATNATTATNATNLVTANFSIVQSGSKLYFKYGATNIASLDSSGNLVVLANVTGYGTP